MPTLLTIVLVAFAIGLLVVVGVLMSRRVGLPWPYLGLAALTSAVCFTVGGATGAELGGPDPATVAGAVVGFLAVSAAVISLVPRHEEHLTPGRLPIVIGVVATVVGAMALVISLLTSS